MRNGMLLPAGILVVLLGCSSSDPSASPCMIVGTYSILDRRSSGTCPDVANDSPETYTISSDGTGGYVLEIQAVTGTCTAQPIDGACKIQGKCDLAIKDPADPSKATGTLQYSWTFDSRGFAGSTIISVPPSAATSTGCSSEYASAGSRK